jgi:TolA-binding protein
MRLRLSVALTACLLVFSPGLRIAHAQEMESREAIALQNEIYQLQQEIGSLRQQLANGGRGGSSLGGDSYQQAPPSRGASNDMVAQLLSRVDTLDDQVRDLRGRIDELQNQTQQQNADLSKQLADLKFQMQNGASGAAPPPGEAGAGPSEAPPPAGPDDLGALPAQSPQEYRPNQPMALTAQPPRPPPPPPTRRTPEIAIHDGYAALAQRDYPVAEGAARNVLNNYRTSPRAYDAQCLLAQALAGEHQYSQAAIAYDDSYNRNRRGIHAAPALVGLASSLASINEKRAACETLVKLHAEFPQSAAELRSQIASVRQRAGCQ